MRRSSRHQPRKPHFVLILVCLFAGSLPARGQSNGPEGRKTATARRVDPGAIQVDGRLDEPAWADAPVVDDFVQKEPNEGAEPTERTEVRFVYDDNAIYIGARLHKRPGSAVQSPLGRRDRAEQAEHVLIALDTFLDHRTAYVFGVTANGVRIDRYHSKDDEAEFDEGFDPVWQARTRFDEQGWTAELWIPFSQLRFNEQEQLVWGLNIRRYTPTLDEDDYWAPVPRTARAWASRFGELRGIQRLTPTRRVELVPYLATTSMVSTDRQSANPFDNGLNLGGRGGADLKWGLGPNLTLEATFNPDFGQVEADPAEVNLSAFETFLDERRAFFLEGADLMRPPNAKGISYFYSRRIGERPTVPVQGDFVEYPLTSTILGAAKLTGRLGPSTTLATLGAITDDESAKVYDASTGLLRRIPVAARTAYGLARAARQFGANQSMVGGMVTAVHRDLPKGAPIADALIRNAFTVEGDSILRFKGGQYEIIPAGSSTVVQGEPAAVARVQRSANHLAQRPDRGTRIYDPTLTSLSGYDASLLVRRTGGAHWIWSYTGELQSPRWETSDIGRLRGNDSIVASVDARYRETIPGRVLRGYWVGVRQNNEWNYEGDRQMGSLALYASQTWRNFWTSQFTLTQRFRADQVRLTRGGPLMQTPLGWTSDLQLRSRPSGQTVWTAQAVVGEDEDGGRTNRLVATVSLRPSSRWQLGVESHLLRQVDTQQYVAALDGGRVETFGRRYVFGTVDRSTYSTQFRLGYTLKPDVNVDVYAEPFAASGRFSRIGELARPRARDILVYGVDGTSAVRLDDGSLRVTDGTAQFTIANNDFRVRSFRSNVVLRWEYRPGSTLYVVWQQDRQFSVDDRSHRVGLLEPFQSLTAPGVHHFVIKTSYWLPFR